MEGIKLCRDCKYLAISAEEEPCNSCICKSNWVDMSEPDETRGCYNCKYLKTDALKTGDIIVSKNDNRNTKNIYIYLYDGWALRIPNYVLVRSECDYNFSTYMYRLITEDFAERVVYPEYASSEDIAAHDRRAKIYYIVETLNEWFYNLIKNPLNNLSTDNKEFKKNDETFTFPKRSNTDPQTVYKFKNGSELKVLTTPNMIKKVIFRDPATIIFWKDGTKTVVKTQDGEEYDKEKGFAMAVCKKVFGNERDYYNVFKRWMRKGKNRHEET